MLWIRFPIKHFGIEELSVKVVQINVTCGVGSTGKICVGISETLEKNSFENYILYSVKDSSYPYGLRYGNEVYRKSQALKSRVFGNYGFNSQLATKKLNGELERLQPDIIHLHNLHSHDCNVELLLSYIKRKNIKLIWTFHDCWAFTGYCTYFTMANCEKWKQGCRDCEQWKQFSWFRDRSRYLYDKKRGAMQGLDLTIVTPSNWLAELVKQSFLKDYPVKVIHNGIDLTVFLPTPSDFREKYGIGNKYIVLGVAFGWGERKGLDVFVELAKRLDPGTYQIVLVGTDDRVDRQLPKQILSIHRTQNQKELAEIYTAADVFANPTREDNYPTVNMEAIACGTPVVTFDTGGSPESLDDTCGSIVPCDDVDALEREIIRICETRPYTTRACQRRAAEFDQNVKYREYIALYEELCEKR